MCASLHKTNYAESVLQGPLQLTFSPPSSPVLLTDTGGRGGGFVVSFSPTHKQRNADSGDSK